MRYTLAITSCNRFGLLQRTLDSFIEHADVLPEATVIVEDSAALKPEWLANPRYNALGRGKWISNGTRRGQIFSLDELYAEVETPYVFHLEDDWLFTRGEGFLRRSWNLLADFPQISTVSLRGNDCNGHPLAVDKMFHFPIQQPGWQGGWGGYSFNPGLRRLADLKHFGGCFGRRVGGYGGNGCAPELKLSRIMLDKGFRIAVPWEKSHVQHIGANVSRAVEPLPPLPRVLLAVPVTHTYDYGTHTSGIKRVTEGRVDAVRDTWMRDAAAHPNLTARFLWAFGQTRPAR